MRGGRLPRETHERRLTVLVEVVPVEAVPVEAVLVEAVPVEAVLVEPVPRDAP